MNLFNESIKAKHILKNVILNTPLEINEYYSKKKEAKIYFKREDLQIGRSYKIRGALTKIKQLSVEEKKHGVVCASAGNHAQGVSIACSLMNINGVIFMPLTTPKQKIKKARDFGKKKIEIKLIGDSFDETKKIALNYCKENKQTFIHPFDDMKVIAGQGTVGLDILEQQKDIDLLIVPIGGGGLAAGMCEVMNKLSPKTKIIGVEPVGAPSMTFALKKNKPTSINVTDNFVDGAAVKKIGELNFKICKNKLSKVIRVPEGHICSKIIKVYNEEGIVLEPAGALAISALDLIDNEELKNKTIVCVISGGNNDISRTEEIKERALIYENLKHYFLINFPQRPGVLKEFVSEVLGTEDDITFFQFSKKNNKETGPAVVGIELVKKEGIKEIYKKMDNRKYQYEYLNQNSLLFNQLIG
ncbi:MAG: threonine ammonia-lyase IlvA [Crocinitomicaceae bacterium]|nr:threonine ammonia-lyase IlvA [Crocinitomicaceae bacterium]